MKTWTNKLTLAASVPSFVLFLYYLAAVVGIRFPELTRGPERILTAFMSLVFTFSLIGIVSYHWTNKSRLMQSCQAVNILGFVIAAIACGILLLGDAFPHPR